MDELPTHGADHPNAVLLRRNFTLHTLVPLRHNLERCAGQHGLAGQALYRFVVAINELTTNAVRHGGGSGHLELWRTANLLHCRVTDQGTGFSPDHRLHTPPVQAIGGRGLWFAHQYVEQLTIDSDAQGTTITASAPVDVRDHT